MKIFKKIALAFLALLILSSVAGYFYFKEKFTPPPNHLTITNPSDTIPITWLSDESSAIAALLLPVTFKGISHQFYMQFDIGSHSTLFYQMPLESIRSKYPDRISKIDTTLQITSQTFGLGEMEISSQKFRVLNYGTSIDWNDSTALTIIGTLGADIMEENMTVIDFKNGFCSFGKSLSEFEPQPEFFDFSFDMRRVLFPATLKGKDYKLLFDTGTSGFELITSKKIWEELALEGGEVKSYDVNSWGNSLTTYNAESNEVIDFKMSQIKLDKVTYIEGSSFVQKTLMRLTGMGGMIGNQLFIDKTLILDCKNEKYAILD